MRFSKLSFKVATLALIGMASSISAQISPLAFEDANGNRVSEVQSNDNWNYLLNYKMWGQTEISFGANCTFENPDGWVGSAGRLSSTGNDSKIAGAIIVGGKADNSGKMAFTTGPVRTGSGITDGSRASGIICSGTATAGACANVPLYRTDMTVPKLDWPGANFNDIIVSDHGTKTVDLINGPYDLYINSFSMGQDATVIFKMPKGQIVRVFTRDFTTSTHPNIVVQYEGENFYRCNSKTSTFTCGGDYEGNLLFYVDNNITFANVDYNPVVGTFISTGTINILCNMSFAGQLLAKYLKIGNEVRGDGFQFVPLATKSELSIQGKNGNKFKENNSWQEINVALNEEAKTNVTFDYCFDFQSASGVPGVYAGYSDVGEADASHAFPICNKEESAKATILKGETKASGIYIKPLIDGLAENDEALWLNISNLSGATLSPDYDNGRGFKIYIVSEETLPTVEKALVVQVNEDDVHKFSMDEFKFKHPTQTFASVKIVSLPNKGSLLYDGAATTKEMIIDVANLGKLTYQAAANEFGNSYATFKYQVIGNGTINNTSNEYTATINVIPVNDKPFASDVTFTVGEQSHIVEGGPIEITDVFNEIGNDTYNYTIVEVAGSDYSAFKNTFEIVKTSKQNATIKVKKDATLNYNQKSQYVVYAIVTDDASTELSSINGPLSSEKFKITVNIYDEPEIIVQQTGISPLAFVDADGKQLSALQSINNWEYLLNYKLWGQTGISFGNNAFFNIADGWIGSAGNLTSTGNDSKIAGAIIVGGRADNSGKMAFTTGPIRTGDGITDAGRVSGTICSGTTTTGSCANVPLYRRDLNVPKLDWPSTNYSNINVGDHGTITVDLTDGPYDLYINSFNVGQDATVIFKMPKGQIVRVFTKNFTTSTHPKIVVQYEGENFYRCNSKTSTFECGGDYEGNLLFYVDNNITFANVDYHPVVGTFISTGAINIVCNMSFAGQLLAKTMKIGNEVKGDGFQFVPLAAAPELSIRGITGNKFKENNLWQSVTVALNQEANADITFDYCFDFQSASGVPGVYAGYSDVSEADAGHAFPICNKGESAKATILKGEIQAYGIYIKPLFDASSETDEKLWLKISNLSGAKLSSDYDKDKGFDIYIVNTDASEVLTTTGGTFTIKENSPIGSPLCAKSGKDGYCEQARINVSYDDIYSTAFSNLTFKRSANNTGDKANDAINFSIDKNGQLFSNADFDYETDKHTYTFLVAVSNGDFTQDVEITVNIEDVQEQQVFVNTEGATVINGNAATGSEICDATQNNDESTQAKLNEIKNEITYTMSEGTTEKAEEIFDVNTQTGSITAKENLVFEALYPNNEFTIVVNASGTNASDETVSANITKEIIVADVNEKPVITNDEPIAISETAISDGGIIGKIEAIDPDSCSFNSAYACRDGSHPQGFNKLHYEIDEIIEVNGSTDFPFKLDPETGVISIIEKPLYVKRNGTNAIKKVNENNLIKQDRYEFIVKVTDSSEDPQNPPLSVKKKIVIKVTPLITFSTYDGIYTAIFDGEYKIHSEFNILETEVDSVVINRKWTPGAYSTLTLPFSTSVNKIEGLSALLKFDGLKKEVVDGQNKWSVVMKKLWEKGKDDVTINAYKPYMVLTESENLIVHPSQTIIIEKSANANTVEEISGWQFKGTLTYKQWSDSEDSELGIAYGFSAEAQDDITIGQFVKVGIGAWISPFRAYLVNKSSASNIRSNYAGAKAPTMSLPNEIDIVIKDEAEEKTTVIGKFNTRTGEIRMNTAKQTYDLKGRNIGNKAIKAKGAYYGK